MNLSSRLLVVLTLLLLLTRNAPADVVDRVVAIVNDDVITLSEVNEEGKPLLQRAVETVPAAEREQALKQVRQKIIEKLIEQKLMQQEAEKNNITVSDEEVDMALDRILARNKISPEEFRSQLATIGLTEAQYRRNLREQVLSSKLVNYEIRSKVIIPEDKIIDYYDTHYTERVGEGGYYILQIGISEQPSGDSDLSPAELKKKAREKAERIRDMALAGKDFRELARQSSDLPSAVDGGDIGVLQKDDMSADMLDAITKTKAGGITDLIETPSGYQFFKVLSSQEGQIVTKVPYESVKGDIYETLYQQEMESRYLKWLQEKKDQAYIKVL